MSTAVLVFLACALVCFVGHVAILVSVVRRQSAVVDPGVPRPRRFAEVIWALIPALALAFVLTATWARVTDARPPKPDLMMKIAR